MDDYEYYDEVVEPEEQRPRDPVIDEARAAVEDFFEEHRDQVFYLKQLQVIFERRFYHWITAKAISELVGIRRLRDTFTVLHEAAEGRATTVRFVFHPANRYTARAVRRKLDLIRRFSAEHVGRACGRQAEILFSRALFSKGFALVGENTRTYRAATWDETGHDLDFIVERDNVAYGCEIKNRFEYIERDEMRIKIRMCKHLGITPLFIMRAGPKSYINEIWQEGGFTKIFEAHIFPFGFGSLVDEIRNELPGMPVDSPRDLPDTILNRFLEAHARRMPRSH